MVTFGSVTIQKLRRITLDQNLLRTLDLEEGDALDVVLLVDTGEIRLRKGAPNADPTPTRAGDADI